MDDATPILENGRAAPADRRLSTDLWWYAQRRVWRFPYRDAFTHERKFLNCTAGRFAAAGIPLPDPAVVRKQTKVAEGLARQLQTAFLRSLASVRPETSEPKTPTLSEAIERFFALYDHRAPSYDKGLRSICNEFLDTVGDIAMDQITDEHLKAYEKRLAKRVSRTSVRTYQKQLGMLIHFGVRKRWVKDDPRLTYKLPKEDLREPDPFTPDELQRFFEICRAPVPGHPKGWSHLEWIGAGMLFLGLRPIELQHAQWEDVNEIERFLYIRRSHPAKMPQACQNQPIPLTAWPLFEARRKESGPIWTGYFGEPVAAPGLQRSRESLQAQLPGFQWKRFRKTYATTIEQAGNDVVTVSRLLRQSAGGKNVTMAQRHYIGKSQTYLRGVVDEAFEPYAATLWPGAAIRAVEAANATG